MNGAGEAGGGGSEGLLGCGTFCARASPRGKLTSLQSHCAWGCMGRDTRNETIMRTKVGTNGGGVEGWTQFARAAAGVTTHLLEGLQVGNIGRRPLLELAAWQAQFVFDDAKIVNVSRVGTVFVGLAL